MSRWGEGGRTHGSEEASEENVLLNTYPKRPKPTSMSDCGRESVRAWESEHTGECVSGGEGVRGRGCGVRESVNAHQ